MFDEEERKIKEEKIEPFVVPEDWEPTDGVVKKIRELTSWIPKELGKKWWDEIQEEHRRSNDRRGAMWKTERERIYEDDGMSDRKKSELEEEKIEPFVVPEDWEPTDVTVKKMRELVSWIPKELAKKWLEEIREEHRRSSDRRGATWTAGGERRHEDDETSDGKKRKTEGEKIEPFVVPEDWEPTDVTVKKMRELVSWIPKELAKKWLEEIREEHRMSK